MEYANGASLNRSKQCLDGTRTDILSEIKDWMSSTAENTKQMMWLSGMAGKGKSAILHTIANWADTSRILGSCFCFDRTREGGRLHEKIFATIARDLADHDPLVRRALAEVIRGSNELRHTSDVERQWEKLLVGPICVASEVVRAPVLILIDALDESGGPEIRQTILRVLSGKRDRSSTPITALPLNVRILITSRPLSDIETALGGVPHIRHRSLDAIFQEDSERDITHYIADELKSQTSFGDHHFQKLAQKADGVFEWARLACWYIKNDTIAGPDARERFESIIDGTSATGTMLLDSMYQLVLQGAIPNIARKDAIPSFRSVMGQIICLSEPLPVHALAAMRRQYPCEDTIRVEPIIKALSALLTGAPETAIPVRPVHASFYDFLTDQERSGEFYIGTSELKHDQLALACLRVMKAELRFNICNLESSYLPNSDVADLPQRIKRCISSQLYYSCRFWTSHYMASSFNASLVEELEPFFDERVLFWLEVLSLTRSLSGSAISLSSILSKFPVCPNLSIFVSRS